MELIFQFIEVSKYINESNLVPILIGISGVLFGIFFFLKRKRIKHPCFNKKTVEILPNSSLNVDELGFTFKGQEIDFLSITEIAFWNEGKEPIRANDIIKKDPLKVVPHLNVKIYDYSFSQTNPNNNFNIFKENDELYLTFDFLDEHDGVILKIFHSGNEKSNIKIKGSYIGAKKITKVNPDSKTINWLSDLMFDNFIYKIIQNIQSPLLRKLIGYPLGIIGAFLVFFTSLFLLPFTIFHNYIFNRTPKKYFLKE